MNMLMELKCPISTYIDLSRNLKDVYFSDMESNEAQSSFYMDRSISDTLKTSMSLIYKKIQNFWTFYKCSFQSKWKIYYCKHIKSVLYRKRS